MSKFAETATTLHSLSLVAMEEASRVGQRTVDLEHLFLALVLTEQIAGKVLRSGGITLENAREAIAAQHSAGLASLGVKSEKPRENRIMFHETGGYEWSNRALEVLKTSSSAGRKGDASAVLRQLLCEPSGLIEELLKRLETSSRVLLLRLDEVDRSLVVTRSQTLKVKADSGSTELYVPAPVEQVWKLLADPAHLMQWEPGIGEVLTAGSPGQMVAGEERGARARTRRLDGKAIRVKPEFRDLNLKLVQSVECSLVEWQIAFPESTRAKARTVRLELEHAAGGTQVHIALDWGRYPKTGARAVRALLVSPLARFGTWIYLSQLGSGISRAFR